MRRITLVLAIALLSNCGGRQEPVSEIELVGAYVYKSGIERVPHGREVLILSADHSFTQTYYPVSGSEPQKGSGTWAVKLDGSVPYVSLDRAHTFGFERWQSVASTDVVVKAGLTIRRNGDDIELVFSFDTMDQFRKEK